MSLRIQKSIGYVLLFIGLISIFIAFRSVQDLFTLQTNPPEVFQTKNLNFSVSGVDSGSSTSVMLTLDQGVRKFVNIVLYSFFMFFVVSIGAKLCGLGIQLVKEKKPSHKEGDYQS